MKVKLFGGSVTFNTDAFGRSKSRRRSRSARPHRNFRLTKRRDYVQPLALPSYWRMALAPLSFARKHRRVFGKFVIVYALLSALIVGLASQTTYQQLSEVADGLSGSIDVQAIGQAFAVALAGLSGGLSTGSASGDGATAAGLIVIGWLTVIWLTRALLRGEKPKLRDGFYNAGAPIVPMIILVLVLLFQLIPAAIGVIGLQAGISSGYITTGIEGMLLTIPVVLLITLSLYWVITTIFAMVIVTLPGMYPLAAHSHAYALIRGRRLTFIMRWLWGCLVLFILWLAIMVPSILLERFAAQRIDIVGAIPIIPVIIILLSAVSLTYLAIYSYQLYRGVVDYDTK